MSIANQDDEDVQSQRGRLATLSKFRYVSPVKSEATSYVPNPNTRATPALSYAESVISEIKVQNQSDIFVSEIESAPQFLASMEGMLSDLHFASH